MCEPTEEKFAPDERLSGQVLAPICLAALTVPGDVDLDLDTFQPPVASDPSILDLAARVTYEADSSLPYPRAHAAVVILTTRDGQQYTRVETSSRGKSRNPMSADDVRQKADAARAREPARIDALEAAIMRLDEPPEARTIVDCAAPAPTARSTP